MAPPAQGASFGNAGCFNPSSVVPIARPGILKKSHGCLVDPLGPPRMKWSYLPRLARWLIRSIRDGTPERIERQAVALKALLGPCLGSCWNWRARPALSVKSRATAFWSPIALKAKLMPGPSSTVATTQGRLERGGPLFWASRQPSNSKKAGYDPASMPFISRRSSYSA
jgi:hypothetical protein